MKKYTYMIMAALLAVAASCKKPSGESGIVEVTFPAPVSVTVSGGETATIEFTASADWEASIPLDQAAWFSFDDNGLAAYKMKGKAGNVKLIVTTRNVENFDTIRNCEVKLKMGGKESVIAVISIMPEARTLGVFTAIPGEDGRYPSESEDLQWSDSPAAKLALSWVNATMSYTLPVKIVANFPWSISKTPDWLTAETTSGEKNQAVSFRFSGNAAFYPLEDTEGAITILDMSNGTEVMEIPVSISGCKDKIRVSCDESKIELNIMGQYNHGGTWTSEGCKGYIMATSDARVVALSVENGKYSLKNGSWVGITYDRAEDSNVLQERAFHISSDINRGLAREAVLLALPGSLSNEADLEAKILNADRSAVAPAYAQYAFATVSQTGVDPDMDWGVITPVNSDYIMAATGGGVRRMQIFEDEYKEKSEKYGTGYIYEIGYNNLSSYEFVDLAIAEEGWKSSFVGPDGVESAGDPNLDIAYAGEDVTSIFRIRIVNFVNGYTCDVVIKDAAGKVLAVLVCKMTSGFWPKLEFNDIHFLAYEFYDEEMEPEIAEMMLPHDVELYEVFSGALYEKYSPLGVHVWRIVYLTTMSQRNAMIVVPPFETDNTEMVEIYPAKSWLDIEPNLYDVDNKYLKPNVHVKMAKTDTEMGTEGYIVLKGAGNPIFVLECERRFMVQ